MINGHTILVSLDGTTIAALRSNSIEHTAELIEKSSATSGKAREFESGRTSWQVTATWLVASGSRVTDNLLRVGRTYTLRFGDLASSSLSAKYSYGTAICTECKVTATVGNLVQGSFRFQGTGELRDSSVRYD